MKKLTFLIAIAGFISIGLSSCSRCEICTKDNSNEIRICEKDYDTNTAFGFTVDTYEASGYKCKPAI
ncbi:MAG: hypothetical protein KBF73_08820 [Flavobacteriales bacterium]|nr:hypothetical protein [Flavobacteriales bacterium]